jgi:hypothetical protein
MRPRAVLLVVLCALLCGASPGRLVADPTPRARGTAAGVIVPIPPGDTHCPVATHALAECGGIAPNMYLLFDKIKGKKITCGYVTIYGEEDLDACPGYRLIHVKRFGKLFAPPPPCAPVECTPGP